MVLVKWVVPPLPADVAAMSCAMARDGGVYSPLQALVVPSAMTIMAMGESGLRVIRRASMSTPGEAFVTRLPAPRL